MTLDEFFDALVVQHREVVSNLAVSIGQKQAGPTFHEMRTRLKLMREDCGKIQGLDLAIRVIRCVSGKSGVVSIADVEPEHYARVIELCGMIRANGCTWSEVPSALCRQESLVGPEEDDGL